MSLRGLAGLVSAALLAGAAAADEFEVTPERACAALEAEGLVMSPWSTNDGAFGEVRIRNFRCLSEPVVVQGGRGRFITSINYYAEGRLRERVETIRLVLNVHRPQTREIGAHRFAELMETLFANLELAPPPGLAEAVREKQEGDWPSDYGEVRFEVWDSPVERLRLTIDLSPRRRPS